MGRKYNTPYKKGKYNKTAKATKADLAKTAWKNLTEDERLWKSDTRKYDMPYRDTGADYIKRYEGQNAYNKFIDKNFKYKFKSKKKIGKKLGRENKTYRKYWRKR